MTVAELIAKLQEFELSLEVFREDSDGEWHDVAETYRIHRYKPDDPETLVKVVVIE